ncbi:MAG TPA: HIT family protein [Burkholderiales bacterium]|nr:HIT family protein [Burkholderiales bacterium]
MRDDCPFCARSDIFLENELAYARYDKYPVNPGHLLVVPFRHFANYFDSTAAEKRALLSLLDRAKKTLDKDRSPGGYNIGVNVGEVAGQTVMHVHIHLIPRYHGDVANPRGGVRGVIPAKQSY